MKKGSLRIFSIIALHFFSLQALSAPPVNRPAKENSISCFWMNFLRPSNEIAAEAAVEYMISTMESGFAEFLKMEPHPTLPEITKACFRILDLDLVTGGIKVSKGPLQSAKHHLLWWGHLTNGLDISGDHKVGYGGGSYVDDVVYIYRLIN